MDEDNNCPIHRRPCVNRKEENYFFRLSRYQQQIEVRSQAPRPPLCCLPSCASESMLKPFLPRCNLSHKANGYLCVQVVVERHTILRWKTP